MSYKSCLFWGSSYDFSFFNCHFSKTVYYEQGRNSAMLEYCQMVLRSFSQCIFIRMDNHSVLNFFITQDMTFLGFPCIIDKVSSSPPVQSSNLCQYLGILFQQIVLIIFRFQMSYQWTYYWRSNVTTRFHSLKKHQSFIDYS